MKLGHSHQCEGSLRPIYLGQGYYPDEKDLHCLIGKIYANRYYTNHGPLAKEFEKNLSTFFSGREVVTTTNAMLALTMTLVALDIDGAVIVPAIASPEVVESVIWAGMTPIISDVNPYGGVIDIENIKAVIKPGIAAIIMVSLWGNVCDTESIAAYAKDKNVKLIHYAMDAFGSLDDDVGVSGDNISATVFSFDPTKIISTSGGGCVVTSDGYLARKIRNIRSSYGAGELVKVPVTANGRFSEMQAALGLWSLENLESHKHHNKQIINAYMRSLSGIEGLLVISSVADTAENYQEFVIGIDSARAGVSRDSVQGMLAEKCIFTYPASSPFITDIMTDYVYSFDLQHSVAKKMSETILQLPVGSQVEAGTAEEIGSIVKSAVIK